MRSEQLSVWVAQEITWALEHQSGDTKAQSAVARNGGYRGWRHEGAVADEKNKNRHSFVLYRSIVISTGLCYAEESLSSVCATPKEGALRSVPRRRKGFFGRLGEGARLLRSGLLTKKPKTKRGGERAS